MPTGCIPTLFEFAPVESRKVVANFDAGAITSDAGGLLLGTRLVRPGAAVVVIAARRGRRLLAAGAVVAALVTVAVRRPAPRRGRG